MFRKLTLKLATFVIGVSLLVGTTTSAWAQDLQNGVRAFLSGDFGTALREFRLLAEQGNVDAQFYLGTMYESGQGVIQDYKEAVEWYRLAAEQGDKSAQLALGNMYDKGQGVIQDSKEAVKWFRLAAEQGSAFAQGSLGAMYGNGQGVIQDDVMAHMWFNIAASKGNLTAAKNRDIVAKLMTQAQIAKAQQLARECLAKNYKGC